MEIVAILVHYEPSYNTSLKTQWPTAARQRRFELREVYSLPFRISSNTLQQLHDRKIADNDSLSLSKKIVHPWKSIIIVLTYKEEEKAILNIKVCKNS